MSLPKIGSITARKIFEGLEFKGDSSNNFADILQDGQENLKTTQFTKEDVQTAIDRVNKIEEQSEKAKIKITSIFDHDYPEKLKRLKKPPVIINYIGDLGILNEKKNCAVIGTRNPTAHGYEYGQRISKKMAEIDLAVVSGLALGCDTAGHKGCLDGNGKTVAVLAQGLNVDKVYPKENRGLAKEIVESGGVLISEYTIDQPANQNYFIERDRIQAGLSDFLFVIETGVKGGTWHTINFAIECKVPIATYKHPEKYKHLEQTLGNQKLISEKKAEGIYSLDDFKFFLTAVYRDYASHNSNEINHSFTRWIHSHQERDHMPDIITNLAGESIGIYEVKTTPIAPEVEKDSNIKKGTETEIEKAPDTKAESGRKSPKKKGKGSDSSQQKLF